MNIDIDGLIEAIQRLDNSYYSRIRKEYLKDTSASQGYIGGSVSARDLCIAVEGARCLLERLREAEKTIANALSELKAGDVRSAIDQLEAGNE
ncbi:hypothetical protein VPH49_09725 [Pseudomonas luteola]|uniref:hypothetical protein n=1 Tax=Pseudomonas luteola TaxID=47886 RepID=UPI003A85BC21